MKFKNYFVKPPSISLEKNIFFQDYKTYSEYNYTKPGLESYLKTRHFEAALRLTRDYFYKSNVIDFGCADGAFLPSLSKYFKHVIGVDKDPDFIKVASKLCREQHLNNVDLICNASLGVSSLKKKMPNKNYHIVYLLETLEHIGEKNNLYDSKINFLKSIFDLINGRGIVVISVPKMIGISLLIQRLGLKVLGKYLDSIPLKDLFKAAFFNNTDNLEKEWNGKHPSFNHRKLEKHLSKQFSTLPYREFKKIILPSKDSENNQHLLFDSKREFSILTKKSMFFQVMYILAVN